MPETEGETTAKLKGCLRLVLIYLQGLANVLFWKAGRCLANPVGDACPMLSTVDAVGG